MEVKKLKKKLVRALGFQIKKENKPVVSGFSKSFRQAVVVVELF